MSKFTELKDWCEPTRGTDFVTTKTVSWEIGAKGSGLWLNAPAGFEFDVSIPRLLWFILSPTDPRFLKAACLHDYALHKLSWARVSAAAAFSEALRANRVSKLLRLVMVISVIIYKWK